MPANEPTADPPVEFDEYELVVLTRGENTPLLDDKASVLLQRQHLGHLRAMLDAGHLKVAGPLDEQPDDSWRGMRLYQVGSVDEARRLASDDPAVRAGRFGLTVMKWYCTKGAVMFPSL